MTITDDVHAKITSAFIDENPTEIVFTRRKRVNTSAGGKTWATDAVLQAQTGRMVFSSNKGDNVSRIRAEGATVDPTATLVFVAGADVQAGDTFLYDSSDWLVKSVARVPAYRTSCEVGHA